MLRHSKRRTILTIVVVAVLFAIIAEKVCFGPIFQKRGGAITDTVAKAMNQSARVTKTRNRWEAREKSSYPRDSADDLSLCPHLGLHNDSHENKESSPPEIKCKAHRSDKEGCEQAYQYYGHPGLVEDRGCDEVNYPDICSFQVTKSGEQTLSCDAWVCGSSRIEIGSINPNMGKISEWTPLLKKTMAFTVQKAVETNRKNGFGFLFFRCGSLLQVLIFPPILQKLKDSRDKHKINVNVILLDSISRVHFYRSLPRAVDVLRKISRDPSIKATSLEFELFQSVGQQTFDNLRPFFSGSIKDDNVLTDTAKTRKAPLGAEVLYGTFKKWGYQTLYQEDLCWFDRWGMVLTDLEIRRKPSTDPEFIERWREFQEETKKKFIDNFGLMHFSGTVLAKYNETNHYETPPKVCLNGKFFSKYFMDYLQMVYTAIYYDSRAKPLLSFMHFNTGHEYTGKRIRNTDANLAEFITNVAAIPDTLTMIFSDHGNKNTHYSQNTEEGRREVFDPVSFMVIPDGVAKILGKKRVTALVENQRRLFTFLDVHHALMSLNDPEKMLSQNTSEAGIFAVLPANRTCADLSLMPLTLCKCEDYDRYNSIKDNSDSHKWLAEFALGTLNNAIQQQHMGGDDGGQSSSTLKQGYGNCQRLVGKSFTNIVQRAQGEYITTTMYIHVLPPPGYKEDEVFKVSVKQYAQAKDKAWLTSFVRVSTYSKFDSCADKSVDIKLCACTKQETAEPTNSEQKFAEKVPSKMFASTTIVKDLHSGCLLFLRRNHQTFSLALEVTNVCFDRTYKFELSGSSGERVYSIILPINLELAPQTFYFLTSINRYTSKDSYPLNFYADIKVKYTYFDKLTDLGKCDIS